MEMTPRMKQIFEVLLQESSAVSVKYLAEQIGVSRRTVQRELESIDTSLRGYDLTFVSKTGVGIRIGAGIGWHMLKGIRAGVCFQNRRRHLDRRQ